MMFPTQLRSSAKCDEAWCDGVPWLAEPMTADCRIQRHRCLGRLPLSALKKNRKGEAHQTIKLGAAACKLYRGLARARWRMQALADFVRSISDELEHRSLGRLL